MMIMTSSLKKQQGMTGFGWLTILGLIIFFALLAMKIAPVYLENRSVQASLDSFKQMAFVTKKSTREIRELIKRKFNINYIDSVKWNDKEQVKIIKKGGIIEIFVNYEVRKNFAGNLFILMIFENKVKLVPN